MDRSEIFDKIARSLLTFWASMLPKLAMRPPSTT